MSSIIDEPEILKIFLVFTLKKAKEIKRAVRIHTSRDVNDLYEEAERILVELN